MRHPISAALALLLALSAARADAPRDEPMKLAQRLTTVGAATFDTQDAKAMAAYYTEDAQVFLVSREKDKHEVKTEVKRGRAEIEEFYQSLFKDDGTIKSKNTVELARLIDPDVLLIDGSFELNPNAADSLKLPFHQVRVKQGDRWLMSSLQIFIVPEKP